MSRSSATGLAEGEVTRATLSAVHRASDTARPSGRPAAWCPFSTTLSPPSSSGRRAGTAAARDNLAAFATSIGIYDTLFAGAGPAPDGRLNEARVAQNAQTMGGADADGLLSQWLHEYVSFALFDASSQLSRDEAQSLSAYVSQRIVALAPKS